MPQATLALRATHQTALTPRLQQSVRLLQLSSNDFAQELEQALATNPFLEVPAPGDGPSNDRDDQWSSSLSGDAAQVDPTNGFIGSMPGDQATSSDAGSSSAEQRADGVDLFGDTTPTRDDADRDGERFDFTSFGDGRASRDADDTDIGSWAAEVRTLRMHLHGELAGHRLDQRSRTLAELVVEAIDDDGYLRQDLADVADRFAFEPSVCADELETALGLVQRLGPPGIAARSVSECLALQLEALGCDASAPDRAGPDDAVRSIAMAIARDHLTSMASRDWSAIRRKLGCPLATIVSAAELIRSLDPRPGSAFGDEVAQSIVPDVIVRRGRNGWQADINPAVIPRMSLNRVYAALFHESRGGDRQPLGQQLQEARWLLRNAAQRFVTIRRVARIIVAEQAAFLDYGDIAIRPLLLRQVADQLDLHESTISRAIGNKFMATPRGIFAFKHFFSRKLATVSGGSCSATSIRAAMRELIEREDGDEPMSDVLLAKRLSEQGLCVARRTVTKYRGLMRIPPVEMRRHDRL